MRVIWFSVNSINDYEGRIMTKLALGIFTALLTTHAFAGNAPSAPVQVPIMTELGLLGMSVILAGFVARFVARKVNKS